jgi:hypothetical protein
MTDRSEVLSGPHAQALRSTLGEVIEFVDLARGILEDERAAGFPALGRRAAAEIERRVRDIESEARRIMDRFAIRPSERNVRGELRAYASRIWADLLDCRSGPMRRYGPPPEAYAERLDPAFEEMAALAHEIVYFAREPEDG